jgi:cytochrome c
VKRRLEFGVREYGVRVKTGTSFYSDPIFPKLRRALIAGCCALVLASTLSLAQEQVSHSAAEQADQGVQSQPATLKGDAERGRLIFGACRTCHHVEPAMGHNNGPNLHRIFGKVAGKQEGFAYYSEDFKAAQFVWTPRLMDAWLENPMAMFPGTTMMSLGVPDAQQRADLIEFLKQATVRDP